MNTLLGPLFKVNGGGGGGGANEYIAGTII